jgi:hypothetical protein
MMMMSTTIRRMLRVGTIATIQALSTSTRTHTVAAFSTSRRLMTTKQSTFHHASLQHPLKALISSGETSSNENIVDEDANDNTSTMTLLEHINLNVPNHDYILDFYCHILGMGLDPRRSQNVVKGSGTVWANCGASQFHLPFGDVAQTIPGSIGLVYDNDSLDNIVYRIENFNPDTDCEHPVKEYEIVSTDDDGKVHCLRIIDQYDNCFYCRKQLPSNDDDNSIMKTAKQPLVYTETKHEQYKSGIIDKKTLGPIQSEQDVLERFGLFENEETECKGISYVEFNVPKYKNAKYGDTTIEDIAEFYNCVFDAPTNVVSDPNNDGVQIAIIGLGSIDPNSGKSSQSILFRQMMDEDYELPKYDGHHIALYVGSNKADFEKAFANTMEAGVVWVNPRFSDRVTNVNTAKKWRQYRFKDLVSLEKGRKIFELEHEVRSIEHDAWPGR